MRGTYLRVGLLALCVAALLLGAVLVLGRKTVRNAQAFETYFRDSVQGLDVGAPVKYRGVAVGDVTAIALVNAEYGGSGAQLADDAAFRQVLVRFAIDAARLGATPPPDALVGQGLRARIAPQGLTGQSYLELDFLDPARAPAAVPWTPRTAYIPSVPSTLSQVQEAGTVLLARMQKIDINALADGVLGLATELRAILHDGHLPTLMAEAGDMLRLLRAGLASADIPGLSAELRRTLAATRSLAEGPQTRTLLRNAIEATDRLTQVTARLPPLLATLGEVARRADGAAADAEAGLAPLLRDARAAVGDLRQTSAALRQDPAAAVLGGPPPRGLPR